MRAVLLLFLLGSLGHLMVSPGAAQTFQGLVDPDPSRATQHLYDNLSERSGEAILFGHHDALAYGTTWRGEPGRSDVFEAIGSYPAVYGWDVARLFNREGNANSKAQQELRRWIREGASRGGMIVFAWHMQNPVTMENFYDTTRAVHTIIPGGERHEQYKAQLDVVASFFKSLRMGPLAAWGIGPRIPVVFRPFHEHTGSWFWWGERHATKADFIALWQFTVEYLRDVKGLDNVMYSYSTDVFDTKEAYLDRYPGDAFIDVLGYDDYHSVVTTATQETFVNRLHMLVEMAEEHGKIAALTETGVETIPDATWWTQTLLPALNYDDKTRNIAWVMVWRNAVDRANHYYAPYPGHPSVPDFRAFRDHPLIYFEEELPDLYR